tara:strand:+ start:8535 stop:9563 length:1029 start_codon:yes stop_codon:yes gene_type:complete
MVPIYFSTSFTYGYDSNILKFSEEEKLDSETESWLLGENVLSSSVVKGSTSLLYIPYIFQNHETKLKVKFNYSDFMDSSDKKYYSYSVKLSQHLGPFEWLKFSYSLLPELYLREYIDRDNPVSDSTKIQNIDSFTGGELFTSSFFSTEAMRIQYSNSIPLNKSYFSISYSKQKQYYNGEFTEFDLDINDFKGSIYLRHIPHIKISGNISKSVADNITFQDGHISTQTKDRGFEQSRFWVSLSVDEKYSPFFDEVGISTSMESRLFSSSLITDPLHMGRTHSDKKTSLWIKKQISNKLNAKLSGSYRSRSTTSTEEFVEGLKSFSKYDLFMTFTYNSNFNIYY